MNLTEEYAAFYSELGYAITQWAAVEIGLRDIVSSFFDVKDRNSLSLGFFSIENFRSKLAFADRTVSKKLDGSKHLEKWEKLVDRVRLGSEHRNKLVHRLVMGYPTNVPGRRYALIPYIFPKPKTEQERLKPPAGSLFIRDVNKARFTFAALFCSLSNFAASVHGQKEPYPKSAEQAKSPMTIEQLRRQIHAILGHPQLSSVQRRRLEDERNAAASLDIPLPGEKSNE